MAAYQWLVLRSFINVRELDCSKVSLRSNGIKACHAENACRATSSLAKGGEKCVDWFAQESQGQLAMALDRRITLLTLTGIKENLTTSEDMRGVERCCLLHVKGNGTIWAAVTFCFTFVKPTYGITSIFLSSTFVFKSRSRNRTSRSDF